MGLLVRLAANALAAWLTFTFVPGLEFAGALWGLVVVAVIIGVINALVRPVVRLLALPLRVMTLGLFGLVINVLLMATVIWVSAAVDLGIHSSGIGATLLGGLVLWVVSWILSLVVPG